MLGRTFASALFIGGQLPLLAEADLEEDQEQGSPESGHQQSDGDHLSGQAACKCADDPAGDSQSASGSKGQYSPARRHVLKLHVRGVLAREKLAEHV